MTKAHAAILHMEDTPQVAGSNPAGSNFCDLTILYVHADAEEICHCSGASAEQEQRIHPAPIKGGNQNGIHAEY